jgi:hypothetical protein
MKINDQEIQDFFQFLKHFEFIKDMSFEDFRDEITIAEFNSLKKLDKDIEKFKEDFKQFEDELSEFD